MYMPALASEFYTQRDFSIHQSSVLFNKINDQYSTFVGFNEDIVKQLSINIFRSYRSKYPDGLDETILIEESTGLVINALDIIFRSEIFRVKIDGDNYTIEYEKAIMEKQSRFAYPIKNFIFRWLDQKGKLRSLESSDASIYVDMVCDAIKDCITTNKYFVAVDILGENHVKVDLTKTTADVRNYVRYLILLYIKSHPKASNTKIGKIFFVDRRTVEAVRRKYTEDPTIGFNELKEKSRGPKSKMFTKIRPEAFAQLVSDMVMHVPSECGLSFPTWSAKCVAAYLKKHFKIIVTVEYLYYFFRKCEITSKVGRRRNPKRDVDEIIEFVRDGYRKLCEEAKARGEEPLFGDETSCQQGYGIRGYAPMGCRANLESSAETRHTNSSLFTLMGPRGFHKIYLYSGSFNARTFKDCLRLLHQEFPDKKFMLILDNARVHHAKLVKEWLDAMPAVKKFVTLKFLPAYAPELNPVEIFNNYYKGYLKRLPLRTKGDVIDATKELISSLVDGDEIAVSNLFKSFFQAEECSYAYSVYNEVYNVTPSV